MHLHPDKVNDFNVIVYNARVMQNYSTSFFPSKHTFPDLVSNADYEYLLIVSIWQSVKICKKKIVDDLFLRHFILFYLFYSIK